MVQGKQREVVNIGLGIKQVAVEPRDATVSAYVESLSHKVCVCHTLSPFIFVSRHEAGRGSSRVPPDASHSRPPSVPDSSPSSRSPSFLRP
jgi:hypothetical protein